MNRLCLCLFLLFLAASSALAQDAPQLRDNRVTVNAGISWAGGYEVGGSAAQLRGNAPGPTATPFTLVTSDSQFTSVMGPEVRVGFSLTPRLTIEGGATLSRPRVGVRIFGDAEAPSQELPGEELQQYVFDGGVTWQLPIGLDRRLAPFATGGAGYLRQLHEDRMSAETGRIYYAGGGARYWLRGGHGKEMPVGVRGDFRINVRRDGIDFEDKMRAYPTFSVFLFIGL